MTSRSFLADDNDAFASGERRRNSKLTIFLKPYFQSGRLCRRYVSTTNKMKLTAAFLAVCVTSTNGFTPSLSNVRFETCLNKFKVFIDGEAGTTGIQVRGRIQSRDDLEIISAPDELRKDEATRKKLINEADVVILCK